MLSFKEWPLVFFTILVQSAVGLFLLSFGPIIFSSGWKNQVVFRIADRWGLVLLGAVGVAILVSLFHLGNPLSAYLAVSNVKSSWLSREIISLGLFFFLLVLLEIFLIVRVSSRALTFLTILAGISGLVLIYVMSKIYRLATVPLWNSFRTTLFFFLTSFLVGGLGLLLSQKLGFTALNWPWLESFYWWASIIAVTAVGLSLMFLDQTCGLFPMASSGLVPAVALKKIYILRLVLLLLAFGLLLISRWLVTSASSLSAVLTALGLMLVLIEETAGRVAFYNLYQPFGS